MNRHTLAEHAMSSAALLIRATFAYLAACAVIVDNHPIRRSVVAILIAVATGAAVRVDRALR